VTGNRHWCAPELVLNRLLVRYGPGLVIVHGGATGIDRAFAHVTASSQTLSASPIGLRARWACRLMVLGTTKCLHETWDGRFSSASRSPWSLRRAKWPLARIGLPMATSLS